MTWLQSCMPKIKKRKKNICQDLILVFLSVCFSICHLFQLSQSGASLDNRVPTPASAASADLHSQHVGADLPTQEVKTEANHDQHEFESAGGKTEPKMEVG